MSVGIPIEARIDIVITKVAPGTPADPMLAATAVNLKSTIPFHFLQLNLKWRERISNYVSVTRSPKPSFCPQSWVMYMTRSGIPMAVASMFTVAPIGMRKRVILVSILCFSSKHLSVIGRVAELKAKIRFNSIYVISCQKFPSLRNTV